MHDNQVKIVFEFGGTKQQQEKLNNNKMSRVVTIEKSNNKTIRVEQQH